MRLLLPFVLLILLTVSPAHSRQAPAVGAVPVRVGAPAYRLGTDLLARTPSGRAGMDALRRGLRHAARSDAMPPEIGDQQDFNTARFLNLGWEPLTFTLVARGAQFHLWVSTRELDAGLVRDADVNALVEALTESTPPTSFNPDAGILDNNHALFGTEPDFDGDGIVDILWFDIFDDFPANPPLVGYIAPQDYDPNPTPGIGNQADVIYVDVDPLLVDPGFGAADVQETVASLHQNLILFHEDPDEGPFVTLGLFGWAGIVNGYDGPGHEYLTDVVEHNIAFFSWENVLEDVERAALFANYLADQLGIEATGTLTRAPENEAEGYAAVLAAHGEARTLPAFLFDFHTANYLNDPAVDPRWGYTTPVRQSVQAVPSRRVDVSLSPTLETPRTAISIRPGSVQYLAWDFVEGFSVTIDTSLPEQRDRLMVRVLGKGGEGNTVVDTVTPGEAIHAVPGTFDQVTVIVVNGETDPAAQPLSFTYAASWTGSSLPVQNTAYDQGVWSGDVVGLENDWQQATRFVVPEGARIGQVLVAPYFLNQFFDGAGNPLADPNAPRDFVLNVWAADAGGLPGAPLFSREVVDPRPYAFAFANGFDLEFLTLDLDGETALSSLPPTIFVGLSNRGTDINPLTAVFVNYDVENVSYLFGPVNGVAQWRAVWDLTAGSNPPLPLTNKAIPIRVQYRFDDAGATAVDDGPALPDAAALHANFPNPFSGTTEIRYDLSRATPVRLRVFDLLGRLVATPVDALQPAGTYTLTLDAGAWAAGVYFFTLETPILRRTRTMTVVR